MKEEKLASILPPPNLHLLTFMRFLKISMVVSSIFVSSLRINDSMNTQSGLPSSLTGNKILCRSILCSYNPQNETCDVLRTKRAKNKTKRFPGSKRSVPLTRFPEHPFFKKIRPGFAGISQPPGSVFEWPPNTVRRPFFFAFSLWVAARPLFALRSRSLAQRFVRGHALRFDDQSAEGQTRPDNRVRIRCIAIRIRARHAAIRIRVVVAAIDHTAYGSGIPICITEVCGGASVETAHRSHIHIKAVRHPGYPVAGDGHPLDITDTAIGHPYTPLADIISVVRDIHPV